MDSSLTRKNMTKTNASTLFGKEHMHEKSASIPYMKPTDVLYF